MAEKKQSHTMGDPTLPLWIKGGTASLAACTAEFFSLPLDTAKVRLQIQGQNTVKGATGAAASAPQYKGMISTCWQMSKQEGFTSLWKGLIPGLQRQVIFAFLRIGLYETARDLVTPADKLEAPPLYSKILAGLITGSIGIAVANPTDVVKIRLQAQGRANNPIIYKGVGHAYKTILQKEGIAGFWTAVGPNMIRNAVINAAELATYDQAKQFVLGRNLMQDNIPCHFVCSAFAGFVATVIGSPVDVLKTRIIAQKSGIVECITNTIKNEGIMAFYKGFNANASRIITWNIIMFMCLQQYRNIASSMYNKNKNPHQ